MLAVDVNVDAVGFVTVDLLECVVFMKGRRAVMAGDVVGFVEVEFFLECGFGFAECVAAGDGDVVASASPKITSSLLSSSWTSQRGTAFVVPPVYLVAGVGFGQSRIQ